MIRDYAGILPTRHSNHFSDGPLGPEQSFVFQSLEGGPHIRAQNLALFIRLAEAVDDNTWLYHLHRGDYCRWFWDVIQDEALADEAALLEGLHAVRRKTVANESWQLLPNAIRARSEARPLNHRRNLAGG
jgi:hypothetical protein